MTSKLMVTIKVGHLHFREASNTSALSFAKVLIQDNLQGWVRLKWIINNSDLNATKSHNTMPLIKNIYAANKLQGSGLFDAVVVHNKTSYQVDSDITMGIWRELIQSNIRFHGMARNWSDNGNSQGCLSGSQKHTSTKPV